MPKVLSFADFDVELSFFADWQLADLFSVVLFAVFCCEEGKFFCFGLVAVGLDLTWQVVTFPFVHLDALFFIEALELELLTFSEKKKEQKHFKYLKNFLETEIKWYLECI